MSKAQVVRRSFSLFTRTPASRTLRAAARGSHETVRVQRVRIRKPLISRNLLIGTIVTTASVYGLLRWIDDGDDEEEEWQQVRDRRPTDAGSRVTVADDKEQEHDEDEDEDGALLFLPTGFSRPRPREYYKGSDPEWQEFARIARDRQRMEHIRAELVALVRSLASKNPAYKLRLGNINPNAGRAWVEYSFPDGPPIEYERPGIELIDDGTLRRTTRPVEEIHHQHLSNALWPGSAADAVYVDIVRKVGRSWQGFKVYVGWEKPKPDYAAHTIPSLSRRHPKSTASAETPDSAPHLPATPAASSEVQKRATSASSSAPKRLSQTVSDVSQERWGVTLPVPSMNSLQFRLDYLKAAHKVRKPVQFQAPRGAFIVSGLVEIIGERARMTLDVSAAYDPKADEWVTLQVAIRSVADYRQEPKGGY